MTSLPEFDDEKPVGLLDFIGNKPPGLLEHFRALSQRRPPGLLEHFRALSQSPFSLGMPPSDFPTPLTSMISGLMSWPPDPWNRNKIFARGRHQRVWTNRDHAARAFIFAATDTWHGGRCAAKQARRGARRTRQFRAHRRCAATAVGRTERLAKHTAACCRRIPTGRLG